MGSPGLADQTVVPEVFPRGDDFAIIATPHTTQWGVAARRVLFENILTMCISLQDGRTQPLQRAPRWSALAPPMQPWQPRMTRKMTTRLSGMWMGDAPHPLMLPQGVPPQHPPPPGHSETRIVAARHRKRGRVDRGAATIR